MLLQFTEQKQIVFIKTTQTTPPPYNIHNNNSHHHIKYEEPPESNHSKSLLTYLQFNLFNKRNKFTIPSTTQ